MEQFFDDYRYRLILLEPSLTSDLFFFFFDCNVPLLQRPFFYLLCSLTLHDTWLTTRGRRGFFVLVFSWFFFLRWSRMLVTMLFLAQRSECQRGENFKYARVKGRVTRTLNSECQSELSFGSERAISAFSTVVHVRAARSWAF